ncbi:hypothetical protein ACH4F6_08835 [Streptomyces sp. NPDC017936]|uniref:hypothetical protein n=1 Tax=Streptomyces sp. NPDC017936 TaxID=3365016 RepID=UPI00378AAF4F
MSIQPTRTVSLVCAAALRGDDTAMRHLLYTCPPDLLPVIAEASVLALADLLREFLPPDAITRAVREAQNIAQTEATERTHR